VDTRRSDERNLGARARIQNRAESRASKLNGVVVRAASRSYIGNFAVPTIRMVIHAGKARGNRVAIVNVKNGSRIGRPGEGDESSRSRGLDLNGGRD
jgi:aspartate 1-decarboxylase